jgi:mRNA-degrading endonuclease RelE of RelBE toxin-antitoxin system
MYNLRIKKRALKPMLGQTADVRNQMRIELDKLESDPDDPDLDIGPISGSDLRRLKFRSRARKFCAIFRRDDASKTITVEAIEPRGQAYTRRRLQR